MEMSSVFENLNWLAIFVATISAFILGGLWYSPLLFENAWLRVNGFRKEELQNRNMMKTFGLAFILTFIMAFNLVMFIGPGDFAFGMTSGFLAGFGWVALGIGVIALFENRSLKYVLINGGYMLVAFTIMGAILGAWK
jgi:hypothetical protein